MKTATISLLITAVLLTVVMLWLQRKTDEFTEACESRGGHAVIQKGPDLCVSTKDGTIIRM